MILRNAGRTTRSNAALTSFELRPDERAEREVRTLLRRGLSATPRQAQMEVLFGLRAGRCKVVCAFTFGLPLS